MQRICGPFFLRIYLFRIYFCLSKDFVNSMCFCCSIYIEIAQTPIRNATNLRTFCFEDYHYAFQETLCPVTLAHIRSLYFIQVYIFIPLINSAPFLRFSHILLYTNFFLCTPGAPGMYITTQNIFLIPDDAVAHNLIIIFNFSSQRPHLNYIFLSYVYSFHAMEFSMKRKC